MCDSLNFKYRIDGSPRMLKNFVEAIQKYRDDPNRIGLLFAEIEAGKLLLGLTPITGEACPPKVVRL